MSGSKKEEYADLKGKALRVFGNRIVVKKLLPPKTGVLELPVGATDRAEWKYARVVQVGPACHTPGSDPEHLMKNDIVMIPDFAGSEIEVDGETVMVIREDEVIGKFS